MMKFQVLVDGSVTDPKGYLASGMHCRIKTSFRKPDVALIRSVRPAVAAGTFTTNSVKAWPLLYDLKIMRRPHHRVIFANSGNANCFNGPMGKRAVSETVRMLSSLLHVPKSEIFVASTGIIGRRFPIEKVRKAIPKLIRDLAPDGGHLAARGILTTDTIPKEIAVRFEIDHQPVTLAVMAKGAGMVEPQMNGSGIWAGGLKGSHATMLCFLTTDLHISKPMLQRAVEYAVEKTFNRLVIDNDRSTNDMVLILANGEAGNKKITVPDSRFKLFQEALVYVLECTALNLAKDGEGVKHVCEVVVTGAKNRSEAERLGRQISTSMLFKTMLAGEDPNWGRLMGCVGASSVSYSPALDISFDGIPVLRNGREQSSNIRNVRHVLQKKEFRLVVNLKEGKSSDRFWATDLTKFYVWINSTYST